MTVLSAEEYYVTQRGTIRYMRECVGEFTDGVSAGNRRRINRLRNDRCIAKSANPLHCFHIIVGNRTRKGRQYSMSFLDWCDLIAMSQVFCFTADLHSGGVYQSVAAAMCVMVSPTILYVQAWGDIEGMEKMSPVTLLAEHIFNFCKERGIAQMDIGIADSEGLMKFKERLGFKPTILA